MTSPVGDSTSVHYTATATFAQLVAEANRAERAFRDLQRAEESLNKSSIEGSRRVAQAAKDRADAIKSQISVLDRAARANDRYVKSFDSVNKNLGIARKTMEGLERSAKSLTSINDKLAASFEKINRSQSGRSGFAQNTKRDIDQATTAVEKFEDRLQALFAATSDESIDLNVNTESALNEIAKVAAEIQLLTRGANEVEIRVNSNRTLLEVSSLARAIRAELKDVVDVDAFADSQGRFRDIFREIAADSAEFRREQARLDRELLEDQIELENRLSRSTSSMSRDDSGRDRVDTSFASDIADLLEENRNSLRSITDSFDSALNNFSDKLDTIRGSANSTDELVESLKETGKEADDASKEIDRLTKSLEDLEKRQTQLAEKESRLAAKRLSDAEKERLTKKQSDVDKLEGKSLLEEVRRLNIPQSKGGRRFKADELRDAVRERYAEPTLQEERRAEEQAEVARQRTRLAQELIDARAAATARIAELRANLAKEQDERRAAISATADERRKADRIELAELAVKEAKRREEVRKTAKEAELLRREKADKEKDLDRLIRDIEKERASAESTVDKRDREDADRKLRSVLKPQPDQTIIDDIRAKAEENRTAIEKEVLLIIDRLRLLKKEIKDRAFDSSFTKNVLKDLSDFSAKYKSERDSGLPVDQVAAGNVKNNLAMTRGMSDASAKDLAYATKLREREEAALVAAVVRAEREKTSARKLAAREAESEAKRVAKELERLAKLAPSERFQEWAKGLADDLAQLFFVNREAEGRFKSLARVFSAFKNSVKRDTEGKLFTNLADGLREIGNSSSDFLRKFGRISGELIRMRGILLLVISAIPELVAGLGSLAGGLAGLAQAAGSALGALAAAPGILAAIASAAGAVALGTSGISDIFSQARKVEEETSKATRKGSDDSVTAARQQRAAARSLRDAYENLADAQEDQRRAQQDVAKAWRDAKEDLIDLQFTVRQGAIDEERAILNLRKARLELARIQAGGTDDPKREKEALLALQEARREYNKILADGNSTAIERAKILRRVNEAEIRYAEATRNKRPSSIDRKEAELDVKDAELAIEEVRERNKRNNRELNKIKNEGLGATDRVISANERLADSEERVRDAQEAVTEAQLRVKEVNEDAAKGSDTLKDSTDKLKEQLQKLHPATRAVVLEMLNLIPAYDAMKRRISGRLFGPLSTETHLFKEALELLEDVLSPAADAVGEFAAEVLDLVTGKWATDFREIGEDNYQIIKNLGDAFLSIAEGFTNITVAAGPFTEWLTKAFSGAAESFKIWSDTARANGTIAQFLEDSKKDLQDLNVIFKNLRDIAISYFKASGEQGDYVLDKLKEITTGWKNVATEQEKAGSPFQKFLQDTRPLMEAVLSLLGAITKEIAKMAADPDNIKNAIDLFRTLEEDVLPGLVAVLDKLSESGVVIRVVEALGAVLDAIAEFLDNGGALAITTYATGISLLVKALAGILALPGVSHILGAVAVALAAVAAAGTVAKYLGIFKLWDFLKWLAANRAAVAGGAAAVNSLGGGSGPDAGNGAPGVGGSDDDKKRTPRRGSKSDPSLVPDGITEAKEKVDDLEKSMDKTKGTAGKLKGVFGNLAGAIGSGGFAGGAAVAALLAFEYIAGKINESDERVSELKGSLLDAAGAFKQSGAAGAQAVLDIIRNNEQLRETILMLDQASKNGGPDAGDLLAGIGGDFNKYREVVDYLNDEIAKYDKSEKEGGKRNFFGLLDADEAQMRATLVERRRAIRQAWMEAEKQREVDQKLAGAVQGLTGATQGATGAQKDFNFQSKEAQEHMKDLAESSAAYAEATATLNNPLATAEEKAAALAKINGILYGSQKNLIEQNDEFAGQLLNLRDAVTQNGRSLSNNTREGQRNREMLKTAAEAAKNFYEQDIAAKVPQEEANRRYKERIEKLKDLATELGLNEQATKDLITAYGGIDTNINTVISMTGDEEVRRKLTELLAMQLKAKNPNISLPTAITETKRDLALANRSTGSGKKPYIYTDADKKRLGLAYGGFVSGPGGPRDDMIQAWLSNREFVQPADATEYYGVPFMEKIRRRQIPKQAAQKLDSQMYADGGHVSATCAACESGHGHAKFANGGMVKWPFVVDASKTKVDPSWGEDFTSGGGYNGPLGDNAGGFGWQWQMQALRKVFPGLSLLSGFRPGSRTANGSLSWHARNGGRAVDIPPRQDVFNWIVANYGKRTKELIWGGDPGRNIYEGRTYRFSDTLLNQHGPYRGRPGPSPHIHWAFKDGGLVDNVLGNLMGFNGMARPMPSVNTTPTPRVLSSAAQSVINNNGANETSYNITVNNPIPQRAGDSIRNSLARTIYMNES